MVLQYCANCGGTHENPEPIKSIFPICTVAPPNICATCGLAGHHPDNCAEYTVAVEAFAKLHKPEVTATTAGSSAVPAQDNTPAAIQDPAPSAVPHLPNPPTAVTNTNAKNAAKKYMCGIGDCQAGPFTRSRGRNKHRKNVHGISEPPVPRPVTLVRTDPAGTSSVVKAPVRKAADEHLYTIPANESAEAKKIRHAKLNALAEESEKFYRQKMQFDAEAKAKAQEKQSNKEVAIKKEKGPAK